MNTQQYNQLFSFIWNIANDVLVQAFTKGDYKKIILPMMVLRRLDILLEPTHDDVFKQKQKLITDNYPEGVHELFLIQASAYPFFNSSPFTMRTFRGEANEERLKQNFLEYLDGFSQDVQDIINKFGGKLPNAVGIPEEQLRKASKSAVCKINIDSDSRLAYTAGVRETLAEHPDYFDPRQYGKVARNYMIDMYKHKITDVLGSENKLAE